MPLCAPGCEYAGPPWAELIKLSRSSNGPHGEGPVQTGLDGEAFKERRKLKLVLAGQTLFGQRGGRGCDVDRSRKDRGVARRQGRLAGGTR